MTVIYSTSATTIGARAGKSIISDNPTELQMARPKEMGGDGNGFNPEQLFAAGYSACFGGALEFIAKQAGYDIGDANVKVTIDFEKQPDGFGIHAEIDVKLEHEEAVSLIQKAHQFCPYSKATKGNIRHILKLNGENI